MVARRVGKKYGGPWYGCYRTCSIFEREALVAVPNMVIRNYRSNGKLWRQYSLQIDVPYYEPRNVIIKLFPNSNKPPQVTVDGPTDSPHRYDENGGICMWYPWHSKDKRWMFEDGLLHLLVLIQAHLFREAWWREKKNNSGKGEWLGPEVPHERKINEVSIN